MAVEDVTHLLDKEWGSAFDQENVLFNSFEGGAIFNYDEQDIKDTKDMLEVDGKSRTLQRVLSLPIQSAPFSIQKGQSEPEVHQFIENAFMSQANNGGMSTSMRSVVAQMCTAIAFRKAYFEKVLTMKEGRVVYDKIAYRPATTCTVQRDAHSGSFKGFRQMPVRPGDTDEIVFPPNKAFVYIHGTDMDPMDGTSDLDIALWCYKTKQKIRFLWYQFLEGQSLPKTIIKNRSEEEAKKAARKLIGLKTGGVVGVSSDNEIDILESSGKGADQFKAAMQWLDSEASGSVLAGFTDLGAAATSGIGSFALSKDQTDFFLLMEGAKSREMQDAINQFLVADLVRYNFGPRAKAPEFEFGPIAQEDAQQAINLLQAIGVTESPVIPKAFYNELIERVASFLELDTQTVRAGLEEGRAEAVAQVEQTVPPERQAQARRVAEVAGPTRNAFNMVQSETLKRAS